MHSERQDYHPAGMGGELLRMQGRPQASAARLRPWALRALSATRAAAPQGQSRAAAQAGRQRQSRTRQ